MVAKQLLDVMYTEGQQALRTLHREIASGKDARLALVDVLKQLEAAHATLLTNPIFERPQYAVDWEAAGMVAKQAFEKVLNLFEQTKDRNAAAREYNRRLRPLLQPKLWQ